MAAPAHRSGLFWRLQIAGSASAVLPKSPKRSTPRWGNVCAAVSSQLVACWKVVLLLVNQNIVLTTRFRLTKKNNTTLMDIAHLSVTFHGYNLLLPVVNWLPMSL
jgi:hypothetical protein